jgi:uncharacterized cupredoxin-like copper-binding protein
VARSRGRLLGAVLASVCLTACGSSAGREAEPKRLVGVVERDFAIVAPRHLRAGDVTFRVRNDGPDDHEFIVVRADGRLPMRPDGLTADEDAVEQNTVAVLEPGERHSVRDVSARLAPGRYEMFCNMSGHLMGGMDIALTVA